MAKINIEFDGKVYSVNEDTLAPLASPLERALIQQLAGTGAVIRLGGTNYNVDANKLASARNVLTDHFGNVAGTDSKVTVNGTEYGLSKTKLQNATDKMHDTLGGMATAPASEGLKFELNEDGVSYSLIGRGTCADTDIVIPDTYEGLPVTALKTRIEYIEAKGHVFPQETGTFMDCTDIKSVTIPDSVTSIGYDSFHSCSGLINVTIGNSVTTIGDSAFYGCTGLTSVTIPDSVTSIDSYAFRHCGSLTNVTIGNSVTNIDNFVFENCDNLTDIYINKPEGSVTLGYDWCPDMATIHWNSTGPEEEPTDPEEPVEPALPASEGLVFKLDNYSQSYAVASIGTCTDTDVVIPDTHEGLPVTSIDKEAFKGCTSLTSVTIPNSVTSINPGAFWGCGFTSVTIPDSVTNIGDFAFKYCESLTSVTIGNGVKNIGDYAFSGCSSLTDIYINKSEGSMSYLGDWWSSGATIHWNSTGPEN